MSSSCLSAATIVRCESLSMLQNGIAFVPVAVQIIFLASLTAVYWRSKRRKHFMVLADGAAFYTVALLDLLSHLVPEARNHLQAFKIFDIVIGALSFVPTLLYTIFLFLFAQTYFLPTIPRLPRIITKYALLALIPIITAMGEVGSFLGISYRVLQNSQGFSFLAIGFTFSKDETLWQFFTSVTLILLTIFQAFIFCFSAYIGISLIQERRVGGNYFDAYTMPTLSGVAWVAIGVKLGAIESVLGFVDGGFVIVLTRRILRMLSRCCLAFGALQSEGASLSPPANHRRNRTMSQIRAMISNPRTSTFLRLSPTAGEFYAIPRATGLPAQHEEGTAHGGPIPRPQRVTIHYDGHAPPELNLRLSDLHVPPAEVLTATFDRRGTMISGSSHERGRSEADSRKSSNRSMARSLSVIAPPAMPMVDWESLPQGLRPVMTSRSYTTGAIGGLPATVRPNPKFSGPEEQRQSDATDSMILFPGGHRRFMSASSLASDSHSVVGALSSQFPGIPPRQTVRGRRQSYREYRNSQGQSAFLDGVEEATEKETTESGVSPSNSVKRKPPPALTGEVVRAMSEYATATSSQESLSDGKTVSQSSSFRRKGMHVPSPIDSSIAGPNFSLAQPVAVNPESATPATTPYSSRRSEHVPEYKFSSVRSASTSVRAQTPGMSLTTGNSPTDPDTDFATVRDADGVIDPFADSDAEGIADVEGPEYRVSELAAAESGLNRIASRVAQYDRLRRQSYRGEAEPSPVTYRQHELPARDRKGKGKAKATEDGWDMVEFPSENPTLGVPISGPRRLSAMSTGSASSLRTATATSGKRVTVAARRGPAYANSNLSPPPAPPAPPFVQTHQHATSMSSTKTRVSHTERELMRIKSVGRITPRRTPTPTPSTGSFATRHSMRIDSVDFSVSDATDPESADSPSSSLSPYRRRPLYDSTGSASMTGVRSAFREGWKAESDSDMDDEDVLGHFQEREEAGVLRMNEHWGT